MVWRLGLGAPFLRAAVVIAALVGLAACQAPPYREVQAPAQLRLPNYPVPPGGGTAPPDIQRAPVPPPVTSAPLSPEGDALPPTSLYPDGTPPGAEAGAQPPLHPP